MNEQGIFLDTVSHGDGSHTTTTYSADINQDGKISTIEQAALQEASAGLDEDPPNFNPANFIQLNVQTVHPDEKTTAGLFADIEELQRDITYTKDNKPEPNDTNFDISTEEGRNRLQIAISSHALEIKEKTSHLNALVTMMGHILDTMRQAIASYQ